MNLRRFFSYSLVVVGAMFFSIGIQAYAVFTPPSVAPPGADADAPLTVGATAQAKVGGLLLNTGGAANGLIVQSGNVGIGTVSPEAKLTVEGTVSITSSGSNYNEGLRIHPSTANGYTAIVMNAVAGMTGTGAGQWTMYTGLGVGSGNDWRMNYAGSDKMSITTGGSVGIGTVSPIRALQVNGELSITRTDRTAYINVSDEYGNDGGTIVLRGLTSSGGAGAPATIILASDGGNVTIGPGGNPGYTLAVNGTAWVSSGSWSGSDLRWKKDIQPITGALDKVLQLSGVSYLWRQDEFPQNNFDDKVHLGFIAQEVEKVVPELVTTGTGGYKGVDYNGFIALLIGAVQELVRDLQGIIARVSGLETRLNAQQVEIDQLKAAVEALQKK